MSIVHHKFIQSFPIRVISSSDREISTDVPDAGVPVYELDTGHLFIGNGSDTLANLTYVGSEDYSKPIYVTTSYVDNAQVGQEYSCMFQCSESLWVSWDIATSKIIVPSASPVENDIVYLDFDNATGFDFSDATVTVKDSLPDGLHFNPSNGLLYGTPTVSGTFSITVTAKRGSARNFRTFTLNILP